VGADHIDEDDVNVTRWAFTSDSLFPPTFKYTFKPGHVLLHSRNPNKVCVPRFNGITGEKLFILKPKDDSVLSADFLPFLLRTNKFKAWAKQWSSGSVNKFLNWSSLANYEFDLPPLDQQRRISEILWRAEEAIQTSNRLVSLIHKASDSFFDDELQKAAARSPEQIMNLGSALVRIVAGKSPQASSNPAATGEYGVLKVSAAGDGKYVETENKTLLCAADFEPSLEVKSGMILVTRCNAVLSGIGRACLVERTRPGLMLSDKTLQLVPDETKADKGFLLQGLRTEPYRSFVERSANGTGAKNVSQEALKASPFWLPPIIEQRRISARLTEFSQAAETASLNLSNLTLIRNVIANIVP
jgi:type I restriction enzyme S subunit